MPCVDDCQCGYITKSKQKQNKKTRGVSHCGLAIYIKKYLKAKEEYYENSNISPCKNIIFKKIL
jgi:hypothetical protein